MSEENFGRILKWSLCLPASTHIPHKNCSKSGRLAIFGNYQNNSVKFFFSALQAHEADDDSMTSHLESSKREMDKLRDEINQIKKMINSKTKETNKLRTQLEKISKERDQAQAKIGKNLDQCSEVNTKTFSLKSFILYLLEH